MLGGGRLSNHSEEPCLQFALTSIDGLALKDFQLDRLQYFLGVAAVMATAVQRPAETGLMKLFEFRFKLRDFHPRSCSASFCVIVASVY